MRKTLHGSIAALSKHYSICEIVFILPFSLILISSKMPEHDVDPVSKLARLNRPDDYILWKRRVFAYIRKKDAELLGFETQSSSISSAVRKKTFLAYNKSQEYNNTLSWRFFASQGTQTFR